MIGDVGNEFCDYNLGGPKFRPIKYKDPKKTKQKATTIK